jgi:hypothetical protein
MILNSKLIRVYIARFFPILIVLVATALVYSHYGIDGKLYRDDAIYLYSGQELLAGVPPFVSIFDIKGPVATMPFALGIGIGRILGLDDVYGARLLFAVIAAVACLGIYYVSFSLTGSRSAGVLAALAFLCYLGFTRHAVSGPRPKVAMVTFAVWSIYFATAEKYLVAGLFGSMAALIWQPAILFPVSIALQAILRGGNTHQCFARLTRVIVGSLFPALVVVIYYASVGALTEMWDGVFLFHIRYLQRESIQLVSRLALNIAKGFNEMLYLTFLGATIVPLWFFREMLVYGPTHAHVKSRLAFFVSFVLSIIWTCVDLQGYPDLFLLLPFTAVGFAVFMNWAVQGVGSCKEKNRNVLVFRCLLVSLLALTLCFTAIHVVQTGKESGLDSQKSWARQIKSLVGTDGKILSIGRPEVLVILGLKNPNPFPVIIGGYDLYIDATTPGGFTQFLHSLKTFSPDIVVYGHTEGKHTGEISAWLSEHYKEQMIGKWKTYVRLKP